MYEAAEFAPSMESPRAARRFVRDVLASSDVRADAAVLLTSELATNAALHARTDFVVRVSILDDSVRVEVEDANERPPLIGHTPPEATSGRGLHLVQAVARTWGVEGRPYGKVVWVEVPIEIDARQSAFAS